MLIKTIFFSHHITLEINFIGMFMYVCSPNVIHIHSIRSIYSAMQNPCRLYTLVCIYVYMYKISVSKRGATKRIIWREREKKTKRTLFVWTQKPAGIGARKTHNFHRVQFLPQLAATETHSIHVIGRIANASQRSVWNGNWWWQTEVLSLDGGRWKTCACRYGFGWHAKGARLKIPIPFFIIIII